MVERRRETLVLRVDPARARRGEEDGAAAIVGQTVEEGGGPCAVFDGEVRPQMVQSVPERRARCPAVETGRRRLAEGGLVQPEFATGAASCLQHD